MAIGVLILGESGTGKTHSIKGFAPEEVKVISLFKPILPFRGNYEVVRVDRTASAIIKEMKNTKKKAIVVDDFQFLLGVPMMKRIGEKGWDKYNDIQQPYSDVLFALDELPNDTIVYFNSHIEVTDEGKRKIKTIGKALDKYLTVEGLFMIVLGTMVVDEETEKKYYFTTQNSGSDTIKSPEDMFPTYAIENNLKYVDEKIRNYYQIGDFLSDDEIKNMDEAAAVEGVEIEKPKRRGRSGKAKEEEQSETPTEEKKKRRVTVKEENEAAVDETRAEYLDKMDELNADKGEEVPMENFEIPEAELPKRKRRTGKAVETAVTEPEVESSAAEPEEPKARRRRRV